MTSFYFTIISFHEEVLGWNAYINQAKKVEGIIKGYAKFQQILSDFNEAQVLPFDQAAGKEFLRLRREKIRVGTMDLRIAAIALARDMCVLTRNMIDFQCIPDLEAKDWTVP